MIRKLSCLTMMMLLCAAAGWATPLQEIDPSSPAVPVVQPSSSDPAAPQLSQSQVSLLEQASDPATESLSEDQILELQKDPEIQQTGWGCCLGDCWEAWGVCMDTCGDQACRNECRAERSACIDDCGQPGF